MAVRLVLRRFGFGLVVLAALSVASFCFFGSTASVIPSGQPVLTEYWTWLRGLWSGESLAPLTQPGPVLLNGQRTTLVAALGHTAALLLLTLVLVLVLSVLLGLAAASRPGSLLDGLVRVGSYVAWGTPAFLLALVVQKLLNGVGSAHGVGPFPIAGWPGSCPAGLGINYGTIRPCPAAGSGLVYLLNVLRYLVLPAATLAVAFVGLHGRYLRSGLLETLGAPFVTTARAKGLSERRVLVGHVLRASAATFVSAVFSDVGAVFGAAMAVDWIFELNGLGTVFVNEFPTTSGGPLNLYSIELVLLMAGALVVLSSLLSELTLELLDPRMRGRE